jgi:hypothetical protein
MCTPKPTKKVGQSEQLERLNRACDFFGDPAQRWNDRLVLEGSVLSEVYLSGRAALVLYCDLSMDRLGDLQTKGRFIGESSGSDGTAIFILKAHIKDNHKLNHWDEKMMLVPDVHVVKPPEQDIPTLVGLYLFDNKLTIGHDDLLLFQSTLDFGFKFFPRIKYWEACPFSRGTDELVPHKVESAPQVVERIANDERTVDTREKILTKLHAEEVLSSMRVVIDDHTVDVSLSEVTQERVNIVDVLVGPLNLFV